MSFVKLVKVVSSEERCEILEILGREERLSFTEIMRELEMEPREEAGSFGYHLNALKDARLIEQDPSTKDYCLSSLGLEVSKLLLSFKDLSTHKPKMMYVRTSSMSIAPFDRRRIEESITREAGAPRRIAEEVAREVEDRLKRLRIGYLTAPLIREIVNTVMIERGMEEFRHLMTRLGRPVYDVSLMIRELSEHQSLPPAAISEAAGETVLNEYLLLRVLPREVADAHLSGSIHLCNLHRWFLAPQNLTLDLKKFFELGINARYMGFAHTISQPKSLSAALALVIHIIMVYQPFVSTSLTLANFNELLSPYAEGVPMRKRQAMLQEFLLRLNDCLSFGNGIPKVSIQLNDSVTDGLKSERVSKRGEDTHVYGDFVEETHQLFDFFPDAYRKCFDGGHPILEPVPTVEVGGFSSIDRMSKWLDLASKTGIPLFSNTSWQDSTEVVYNTDVSRIAGQRTDGNDSCTGILGTAAVNMPRMALMAKSNESKFEESMRWSIKTAMAALTLQKSKLVEYLKHSSPSSPLNMEWDDVPLFTPQTGQSNITLVGMYEAAANQRNIDLSHVEQVVDACLEYSRTALATMREEQGNEGKCHLTYASSEPVGFRLSSLDAERLEYEKQSLGKMSGHPPYRDYSILPDSNNISVERRVEAESKLQPLFSGGHILNLWIREPAPSWKVLARLATDTMSKQQIGLFSFSRDFTLCYGCGLFSGGLRNKCENCGGSGNRIEHLTRRLGGYRLFSSLTPFESHEVHDRYRYLL